MRPYDYGHRDRINGHLFPKNYERQLFIWGNPSGGVTLNGSSGSYTRTIDQRLPYWKLLQRGTLKNDGIGLWFDPGSYFWKEEVTVTAPNFEVNQEGGWPPVLIEKEHGPVWPCVEAHSMQVGVTGYDTDIADKIAVPFQDLMAYSATGVAHSLPSVPPISLFSFFGEAAAGLPKIPGVSFLRKDVSDLIKRERRADAGQSEFTWGDPSHEFLNWVFGWAPTFSDIENILFVAQNYGLVRDRMVKLAGKVTRRHRVVLDINEPGWFEERRLPYPPVLNSEYGQVHADTVFRRKIWVDSGFSFSPLLNLLDQKMAEVVQMMDTWGVIPNPANIWELIPFSWLVDWFSNVGDVLTNLSYMNHNGLRLLYSYVMAETEVYGHYTWKGKINGGEHEITSKVHAIVKQRFASNPYWVGTPPADLGPMKIAILAAIGVGLWPKRM